MLSYPFEASCYGRLSALPPTGQICLFWHFSLQLWRARRSAARSFMRRQKLSQHVRVWEEDSYLAQNWYYFLLERISLKSGGVKGVLVAGLGPTYTSQADPVFCSGEFLFFTDPEQNRMWRTVQPTALLIYSINIQFCSVCNLSINFLTNLTTGQFQQHKFKLRN